jgi:hypothetical protein
MACTLSLLHFGIKNNVYLLFFFPRNREKVGEKKWGQERLRF